MMPSIELWSQIKLMPAYYAVYIYLYIYPYHLSVNLTSHLSSSSNPSMHT